MVGKIADLGVARIVPRMRAAATMTKAPGASIYMPPEALEDKSRYDATIDIFSIGVLAIFTLSQTFPDPLSAAYMDDSGVMVGRTELERRESYMREIRRQFRKGHPLLQMIQHCLKNRARERPTIQAVVQSLEQARTEIDDGEYDVSKLTLVQDLRSKNEHNEQLQQQNEHQREENEIQKAQIESLQEQLQSLQIAKAQAPKVCINCVLLLSLLSLQTVTPTPKPRQSGATSDTAVSHRPHCM